MTAIRDFINKIDIVKQQTPAVETPTAATPHAEARAWLAACGYIGKYAMRYDPTVKMADEPSEEALKQWVGNLPQMLDDGGWLLLGGALGTRKSFATCRIVDAARKLTVQRSPEHEPRQLLPGSEVCWHFAPSIASYLQRWEGDANDEPGYMYRLLRARLLVLDDVDRFLELRDGDYTLGKLLSKLDTLMEYRDQPYRVTVVTANRHAAQMYAVPEFRRWVDRAKERGACIDIMGRSTRWSED